MERDTGLLHLVAVQLAFVVALIHLLVGLRQWLLYAVGGILLPPDIRIPLWVASGLAILAGVVAAYRGAPREPLYILGIGLMLVFLLGYFSWHLGGHRAFFIAGDPRLHGTDPVSFVVDHVFAGPIETAALATETALLGVLGWLLYVERSAEGGGSTRRNNAGDGG